MTTIENDRRYTKDHEWTMVDDGDSTVLVVGITDYAQSQLGDVVMVELPEVGDNVDQGEVCGAVESPKSVSDIFSPVSGQIVAVNEELLDQPELVNAQPYDEGWMLKFRMDEPKQLDELMDAAQYKAFVEEGDD